MRGARFISRPLGEKWLWHLFILHLKKWHEKPQKPCGVWGSATGIYFGHLNHKVVGLSNDVSLSDMMHRLWRYDVFRFAQNDVAPLRVAMM